MLSSTPAPAPTPMQENHIGFEDFLSKVLPELHQYRQTPDYALQSGVCLYKLMEYASGKCPDEDRRLVNHWLTAYPWAMQFVVNLVKENRPKKS